MNHDDAMREAICAHLHRSLHLVQDLRNLALPLAQATMALRDTLTTGHKVLLCGNGGSAAMADHLAAELLGRYRMDRPGLPAIALTDSPATLTALANDFGYEQVFARQVHALGQPGDLLIVMSCSGRSANILAAITAARNQRLAVLAMTGADPSAIAPLLHAGDLLLPIAATEAAHIQEGHLVLLHALMSGLEASMERQPW